MIRPMRGMARACRLAAVRCQNQPGQPGGTGHNFDWTLLAGYRGPTAWMLAGGLDASTVGRAVAISRAQAVDVSSGVENQPGKKDPDAIHAFIHAGQLV